MDIGHPTMRIIQLIAYSKDAIKLISDDSPNMIIHRLILIVYLLSHGLQPKNLNLYSQTSLSTLISCPTNFCPSPPKPSHDERKTYNEFDHPRSSHYPRSMCHEIAYAQYAGELS